MLEGELKQRMEDVKETLAFAEDATKREEVRFPYVCFVPSLSWEMIVCVSLPEMRSTVGCACPDAQRTLFSP
jgi:hypothetical protein